MQSSTTITSYTEKNLFFEYIMFLIGAAFLGGVVVWAEFPHGVFQAAKLGGSATIFATILATFGFFRRRSSYRHYLQMQKNRKHETGASL